MALLLFLSVPAPARAASSFVIDTASTITLHEDNGATVRNVYKVRNLTRNIVLSSYNVIVPLEDISNVSAASGERSIPVSVAAKTVRSGDIEGTVQEISISFPVKVSGLNRSWQFTLEYDTADYLEEKGTVKVFYHPQISTGESDGDYSLTVIAPASFGEAHYSRLKPSRTLSFGSTQSAVYGADQVTAGSFEITYGDFAVYSLNFNFPVKNPYPFWRNVSVTLPPQLATQEILIKSINPRPSSVAVDDDGNVRATFFANPLESFTVTTDIIARIKIIEYDLSISGGIEEIPDEIAAEYTRSELYWERDNQAIVESAKKHFDRTKSVAENVRALYRYTIDTLTYNDAKILFNERQGALKALENPANSVCMEYADFLIAHLRAVGIPARNPIGYAYSEGLKESPGVADSLHSWVEAYIPNVGWTLVDPTWGEKIDNFGTTDVDHVAFAMYGKESDDPQPIYAGGRSTGYQYEDTALNYGEDIPDLTDLRLEAISYPLPFFVLTHVKAMNGGNTTLTDVALRAEGVSLYPGNEAAFGTSAPYQESEFFFISPAVGPTSVSFELTGIGRDGRTLTLGSAESDLPLELSRLVAAAAVIFILWWPAKLIFRKLRKGRSLSE